MVLAPVLVAGPLGLFLTLLAVAGGLLAIGLAGLALFFLFVGVVGWSRKPTRPGRG